jgi:multidrug resistance protein MdtO
MSTAIAQTVFSPRASNSAWIRDFLREELAPYPGRMALVVRMMVAATLVMIVSMTFKLPQGAYGAVYALTLSRESPQATISAVKVVVVAFVIAAAWELNGAIFSQMSPYCASGGYS